MLGRWRVGLAPIIAGLGGLAWIWAELAPQRFGFEDTDDPAVSLRFLAEHPDAYAQEGIFLAVAAIAVAVTVLAAADRLGAGSTPATSPGVDRCISPMHLGDRVMTFIGQVAAVFLFGMSVLRLSGGPLLYVRGLDQAWGEAAYLAVQFVGVHLLAQGGTLALSGWILMLAWRGVRAGSISRVLAALAVIPGLRVLGLAGPFGVLPEELWIVFMAAIPGAFGWLVLLGASWLVASRLASRAAPVPSGGG
jgi:hypothetical protein